MKAIVENGAKELTVRETAVGLVQRANVAPRDFIGELETIFNFVRDAIRFTRDIAGVETLQAPGYTLQLGAGDCDDKAMLLAALLRSIGHPAELAFKVIGTDPQHPTDYTHVYVVARLGGRQIPLDPSVNAPAGWQYPHPNQEGVFQL